MRVQWTALTLLLLISCKEELPPKFTSDVLTSDGSTVPKDASEVAETKADTSDAGEPLSECELKWNYTVTLGGNANHPVVDKSEITTITTGNACLRVTKSGGQHCSSPFVGGPDSGIFGAPAQTNNGTIYFGSAKGDLYALTDKCTPRWKSPVRVVNSEISGKESLPIRVAPVINGDDIYLLDDRPSLHKCFDNKSNGICGNGTDSFHFWVNDDPLENAAPAYVGGPTPVIVFPTRKKIIAVDPAGSLAWEFGEFAQSVDDQREVNSTIAITSQRKIVFIGGESLGNGFFKQLQLFRLLPDSDNLKGVMDLGFPKTLKGLSQDRANALVIGPDNSIYVATNGHGVVKLNAAGDVKWAYIGDTVSARVTSAPALGNDGALYFMGEPHYLFGIDSLSRTIHSFKNPFGGELVTTSPAISNSGLVLVHFGTDLMALKCDSTGLAVSSWPRYQRNNRASGNSNEQN
jgi:outer membrane protein assembly factor BamB